MTISTIQTINFAGLFPQVGATDYVQKFMTVGTQLNTLQASLNTVVGQINASNAALAAGAKWLYVAYAADVNGTNFSLTDTVGRSFVAILPSQTEIVTLTASHFAGKWRLTSGTKGDKGDTGATGAKGDKGDKGDTGATGAKGDKGDTGATGAKGDTGVTGMKGDTGEGGIVRSMATTTTTQAIKTAAATTVEGASLPVVAGKSYLVRAFIYYRSSSTANGLGVALLTPAGNLTAQFRAPHSGSAGFTGSLRASGIKEQSLASMRTTPMVAMIDGVFIATASGNITLQACGESTSYTITMLPGTHLIVEQI